MILLRRHRQYLLADPTRRGAVQVALAIASTIIAKLAARLLRKKTDSPIKDDKPVTLSTRGSYTNWFVGIRRVGPVFAWAGFEEREVRKEKTEGAGKGGDTPEQDVWYEPGWHILGIGPCSALYQIIQGGEVIFNGPITSESHPSGSTVDLGKEGSFTIYWGEQDQPVNTYLGDSSRVTISSRWPFICYIVWNKKRLGTSHAWPLIDYVVERRPSNTLLSDSDGWYDAVSTLSGTSFDVVDFNSSSNELVGYLQFEGDQTSYFKPRTFIELSGNGLSDGTYEVLKSETVLVQVGTHSYTGFPVFVTYTRVFLQGGTLGADDQGSAETYINDYSDGANIAHVIAELLFADFPMGLQIDPAHTVEKWDLDSLEELGVEAETDGWRASVVGSEGESADALLGGILQDHGTLLPIDTATGALKFQRVRFPVGTLPNLEDDIFLEDNPEIETMLGEQPADRTIYAFQDRVHLFGDMTLTVDDDGHSAYLEHQNATEVAIISTVRFHTAALLSEIRSPEDTNAGIFSLQTGREARGLIPGQAITADGFDEVLRVLSVDIDPLSEVVTLKCAPDFYGARKSDFVTGEGGGTPNVSDPQQDEQFIWAEVPEQILGGPGEQMAVLIPRIRANAQMSFSSLWLSRDNSTYELFGNDQYVQTGGVLDEELPADGPTYVATGPEYTELGPDNGSLTQDLSADLVNWGLGRQLCLIFSDAGYEICFVQKASIVSGTTRRLDGLLRARYDTRKVTHPAGAQVYIFDRDLITPVQDILLEPGQDLYVKSQPGTSGGQVNLSAVPPFGNELVGKGPVPIKPDYVRVRAPYLGVPGYFAGDDITIAWAISTGTPVTGAGLQGAGTAIGAGVIPGSLQIEFLDSVNVVQLEVAIDPEAVEEYTLTNAALIAAFGGEPATFKVRVTHVANGFVSEVSPTLTITKLS